MSEQAKMSFLEKLSYLVERDGITMAILADQTGIARDTIYSWYRRNENNPKREHLDIPNTDIKLGYDSLETNNSAISKHNFNKEFDINKIPLEVEVPKIFSKFLSYKISELIKVTSSRTEYRLLSIEEKRVSKIVLIVLIIIWEILFESSIIFT